MGLLKKGGLYGYIKKHTVNPTRKGVQKNVKELKKSDTDWEHLTEEGELPWGWHTRHHYMIEPYEKTMVQMADDSKKAKGNDKIKKLEKLIKYYYIFKKFCYTKNECFAKYFQDMWQYCHNSKGEAFEYIEPFEKELKELKGQE